MYELINKQVVFDALMYAIKYDGNLDGEGIKAIFNCLPTAQAEPLTVKEQMIFLAAMSREEKVCKEVDEETVHEAYEDTLVQVCKEIIRKVKGVLWT